MYTNTAVRHALRPALQIVESLVGLSRPIQVKAMAVEAPRQRAVGDKPARIGQRHKVQAELLIRRIGFPESLIVTKIPQSGIDAHARAGADEERVSGRQNLSCPIKAIALRLGRQDASPIVQLAVVLG